MREIIFDTETTGLSPAGGDRMVEIGCVEMVNRVETGRTYHAYFNPDRPMPREAEAVHGLSDTFLSDKPMFGDTVAELLEFVGDAPLIAHNATFDFGFLNHELQRCSRDPPGVPVAGLPGQVPACGCVDRRRLGFGYLARAGGVMNRGTPTGLIGL